MYCTILSFKTHPRKQIYLRKYFTNFKRDKFCRYKRTRVYTIIQKKWINRCIS